MIGRLLLWSLLVAAAVLATRRHLDVVEVRGRSMAPALLPGDRLLVARIGSPRTGAVVLAADPRDPRRELVKRVSGFAAGGVVLSGDNPSGSTDARTFGAIPPTAVTWRVIGRYWPADRIGRIAPPPAALIAGEPSVRG